MNWTERRIGAYLQRFVFNREVVVVDNCSWTGSECDLLIVEPRLRVIDVEIKISRADLKADAAKDKWLDFSGPPVWAMPQAERPRKLWPRRVWKHYYALPAEIWTPELEPCLGSPASGVMLLRTYGNDKVRVDVVKRPRPNRDAESLTPDQVLDVARLATLRLWTAYERLDAETE